MKLKVHFESFGCNWNDNEESYRGGGARMESIMDNDLLMVYLIDEKPKLAVATTKKKGRGDFSYPTN